MQISIRDILSTRRHITFLLVGLFLIKLAYSCEEERTKEVSLTNVSQIDSTYYKEPFRPQFHFSPEKSWMNDPNGLVYHKEIYHLFYQYYPDSTVWGPMHWGHAISKDLLHWQHKPIALFPDEHGYIFSGSAVVDFSNSSGFGSKENPPLVAVFTYHLMECEKVGRNDFQTQGIAYSLDDGEIWKKYEENPVIKNPGIRDFRDPKVFWDEERKQWVLVLVAGDHAQFYRSNNLKEWHFLSDFGKNKGAHGGVWECPDLFKIPVEGMKEEKWVLLISINPGAPNGGSGTQYFVGDFDGMTFTTEQEIIKWIDYGTDNYAGVTYNNVPNGQRLFIGWMSNWNYAQVTPTQTWRSAMTLPRELTLVKEGEEYFLKNYPIDLIAGDEILYENRTKEILINGTVIDNICLNQTDIRFDFNLIEDLNIQFRNSKNNEEKLEIFIDPIQKKIGIDRMKSGLVDFHKSFADNIHYLHYEPKNKMVEVRMIIDKSSIEVFIDKGRYVFTEQLFLVNCYDELLIAPNHMRHIENLKYSKINSIWHEN